MQEQSNQWSRRSLLGFAAAAPLAFAATDRIATSPGCLLTPEQEIGPYYLDRETFRYDVTEGKPGVPLKLRVAVMDVKRCAPLSNVALDIWHCDATGIYSGFTARSMGFGPPPGGRRPDGPPPGGPPRDGQFSVGPPPGGPGGPGFNGEHQQSADKTNFLRGVQLTDRQGVVEFATLYPGWYQGRAVHIHLRVHVGGSVADTKYQGGHVSHTGQLFFPEELSDRVYLAEPYKQHQGQRLRLTDDHIYTEFGARSPLLGVTAAQQNSLESGLTGTVTIGVDPESTPALHGFGGGGPRPQRPNRG